MKITESALRRIINQEICSLVLQEDTTSGSKKMGSATSSAEGSLDVKKLADTLGIEAGRLKLAITNLRSGKRGSSDNQVFGDLVAKLLDASEQDTVKAMTVLKKVEAE